jgi:hypothetical protein
MVSAAPRQLIHAQNPPNITTLPPELHLKIFDIIDEDESGSEMLACLGLTYKTFYPLYFDRHPKTKLRRLCDGGCFPWMHGHNSFA